MQQVEYRTFDKRNWKISNCRIYCYICIRPCSVCEWKWGFL